ncbi:hypothetical protein HYX58_05320 [Candidatus Dependentiae bacterium]|nr:hypothetical protein [Candidatus Dependentiae bacterium]
MKFFNLSLISLFFAFNIGLAMEIPQSKQVDNKKVTPENIYSLQQRMSQEDEIAVKEWVNQHKELLQKLVPTNEEMCLNLAELKNAGSKIKKLLDDEQLTSVGNHNIVIPAQLNGETKYFHLTSPGIRAINLLHSNKKPNTNDYYGWELDKISEALNRVDTFQTVSQVEHFRRAQETMKKNGIAKFDAPYTRLVQVPGRSDISKYACDANSIVVQDEQKGFDLLKNNLAKISNLSPEAIANAYPIIVEAPCWDAYSNLRINEDGTMLGYVDWEQASNRGAHKFGTDDKDIVNYYKVCAIEGFAKLFKDAKAAQTKAEHEKQDKVFITQDQITKIRNLVHETPEFKNKEFNAGHIKQLEDALPTIQ